LVRTLRIKEIVTKKIIMGSLISSDRKNICLLLIPKDVNYNIIFISIFGVL